jgi:hypothetical protein
MADGDLTLKNLTDPVEDLMQFIPPASSAFRSYLIPGFFGSGGQSPSITPNPLRGDAAEAAPAAGEAGYVAPPEPPAPAPAEPSMLQGLTSIDQQSRGSTLGERTAAREKDIGDAGEVTDPMDAVRAVGLGLSLTSPTGIATLAAQTGANLLGAPDELTDPVGALLGNANGNPWDLKSNTNRRPGYDAAYDAALKSAHNQGLSGSQAGQYSLNSAKAATDINAGAAPFGVHRNQAGTSTPQDVTAANGVTGFAPPSAPTAPAASGGTAAASPSAPATSGVGTLGAPAPASSTSAGVAAPTSAPATTGFSQAQFGGGQNGGGSRGGGSGFGHDNAGNSNAGRRGFADGGVVAEGGNPMFRSMTQSTTPADVGQSADPYQDQRYNPPAEAQDPQGVVDGVPAQLTPGEFVIMRDAAQEYSPEALAALNDPRVADQINELIESLLGGSYGDDDEGDDPTRSDDNSGLGTAGRTMTPTVPRGGSMLRSLSRVS